MKFDKEPWEALAIDMTPLVDAIFAIILFLLVAASFVQGMVVDYSIELPTQGKELKVKTPPARPITVNVRNLPGNKPEYNIENTRLSLADLRHRFSLAKIRNRDQSVVIRGDRNCKWEHIAAVMTRCGEAGITKVYASVAVREGT
ncbi:MAG: biopolymer transporter ExbD [Thermoguttaceae bacterium]|jgi:biopolymer transport protein ExbD